MRPIEILKQHEGMTFTDEDGDVTSMKLLPPLSAAEFDKLQKLIPCPIPDEARELFEYARGIESVLEEADFSGLSSQGTMLDDLFPCALQIACDGYGNDWVVCLDPNSTHWGPILYFCHDPAAVVYQCDTLAQFISELIRFGNEPWQSEIDDVHEKHTTDIYLKDPWKLSYEHCINSGDAELAKFASSFSDDYNFYDLRNPKTGMGFPITRRVKADSHQRLFAVKKRKSLFSWLFGKKT